VIGKRCKLPGQGADIGAFESDDIVSGALRPKRSVRVSLTMSRKDIVHENFSGGWFEASLPNVR